MAERVSLTLMPHSCQRELRVARAGLQCGTLLEPSLPVRRGISQGHQPLLDRLPYSALASGARVLQASSVKAERLSQGAENDYPQYPSVKFPVDDGLQERRYFPDGG